MTIYEKTRSTERPDDIEVRETQVFTAANVQEVTVDDENGTRTEYEFTLTAYDKDEYIKMMADANTSTNAQLTDAQLALCELYELMMGD